MNYKLHKISLFIISIFFFVSCLKTTDNKENDSQKKEEAEENFKKNYAIQNNAIYKWENDIDFIGPPYTSIIQEYFEKLNQPILIDAFLVDITKRNDGQYILEIEGTEDYMTDFPVYYKITCSPNEYQYITSDSSHSSWLIIANIFNVKKGFRFDLETVENDDNIILSTIDLNKNVIIEGQSVQTLKMTDDL